MAILVSKLDGASFYQSKKIMDSAWADGHYTIGIGFNFNFKLYKENSNYKAEITSLQGTFFNNEYAFKIDRYIDKIALGIKIGNKNVYYIDNILEQHMLSDSFTCNDLTNSKMNNPINFNFNSSDNIDSSNLNISFYCYRKSEYEYTFEESFNAIVCNEAPKIEEVTANFPNVSFKVSDDKKVSKVEVFINNSLKRTIVNGLNDTINLNFARSDFNIGQNTLILKVIDNENVVTSKTINVKKGKVPIPKKGIKIVKKNKIYTIVSAEENLKNEELILTLDRNLEEVSSIDEPIEILDKYAIVKINDKPMKHVSSKNISNDEVEDKFELDITTRKVTLRVDLERVDSYGSIYIREIQEAFQYNND